LFPRIETEYHQRVECHTKLYASSQIDVAQYNTLFVHERNDEALEWAEEAHANEDLECYFIFRGDKERVTEYKGIYTLPRAIYYNRFNAFLRAYKNTREVRTAASVFKVGDENSYNKGSFQAESEQFASVIGDPIAFAIQPAGARDDDSSKTDLSIVRRDRATSREIDYQKTLSQLRDFDEPRPIVLEETYLEDGDGLYLMLHLRLEAAYNFSRFPVVIRLQRSLEAWIRHDSRLVILATRGTLILSPGESPQEKLSDDNALMVVSPEQHLTLLERLPIAPEGLIGRHDLANEWGPIRLYQGMTKLERTETGPPDWMRRSYHRILGRFYYKYLFALLTLRGSEANTHQDDESEAAEDAYRQWIGFLESRSQPIDVLLIDDEAEPGWKHALGHIFAPDGQKNHLRALQIPDDINRLLLKVEREIESTDYDLVFVDLRLIGADQSPQSRGSRHLSGVKVIGKIKEARPELPVIAVTASNKAWTSRALQESGADGYWIKENPQFGVDVRYAKKNAAELLTTLRTTLARYGTAAPVWTLISELEDRIEKDKYVFRWADLNKKYPNQTKGYLRAIIKRLRNVYGYMTSVNTDDSRPSLDYYPRDQAFLTAWSIINEVAKMFFDGPRYRRSRQLHETSGSKEYRFFDPREKKVLTYWRIVDGRVEDSYISIPGNLEKYIRPLDKRDRPIWPDKSVDNPRVAWLLHRCQFNDRDMDVNRFRQLRELRNDLELTHGDVTRSKHAAVEDILDTVRLWTKLLHD
jgi:CheY-like chemotaxis protein